MTNCWFCGTEMIWQSDFNPEDFGIEGDGIVAILHCPNCDAEAQFTYVENNEEK